MLNSKLNSDDSVYRTLFEGAGDAMYVHTHNNILAVNRKTCELLGYAEEELLSLRPSELDDNEHRMYMPERMAKLKSTRTLSFETTYQKKDGTKLPIEVTAQAITWNGELAVMSICRDNSTRKRYDDVLLEAAMKWQQTFDAIKDAVFLLSPECRILRCNNASYGISNKRRGEILGKYCWEVVHGMPEQIPTCPVAVMRKTGKRESSIIRSGEKWLEITVDPVIDEKNNIIGAIHVVADITERKRVEDEKMSLLSSVQEEKNRLSALLDGISDEVWFADKNGKFILENPAALREFRLSRGEAVDVESLAKSLEVFRPDGTPRPVEEAPPLRALSGEVVRNQEEIIRTPVNGELRYRQVSSTPVIDAAGNIMGSVTIVHDITDSKKTEREKAELEEKNRQLQKMESLSRLAGSVSHHFNNQLSIVMGYLDMVIGELPPCDPRAEKLRTAMQASQKASDVNGLLLAYLGQMPTKLEMLDLADVCRNSLPLIQAGNPKNVDLKIDLHSPGPCISADVKQVQQLMTNLVINAWEAIGDGAGTVQLSVRSVLQKDIPSFHRFPADWQPREHTYACLEVMDSGCGMHDEDMDKIFDPFFSTKLTGRGLGLSVVFGIVRNHDAAIRIESNLNHGSVFSVFFPLSLKIASVKDVKLPKEQKITLGDTVLLVDDNEPLREMTKIFLISLGFKVFQAGDGVEALEIFKKNVDEISWLFCDLTMPRMGGWETISALRAIRHDLPVVLTSGYDEERIMNGGHEELPDLFLPKPYDLNKLCNTIGHFIHNKNKQD